MNKPFMLKTTLAALAGWALILAAPNSASGQASGAEVWARSCGRCHRIQPPTRYDARHWEAIVGHMALNARLTSDEEDAVREFLMGAARKIALEAPEESPREIAQLASLERIDLESQRVLDTVVNTGEVYRRQCVACHGETGEGNGPAAVAFNPKPANLTDPEFMSERTDEELLNVLRQGKGAMPAFSAILSDEDLVRMVRYIRTLSAKPQAPGGR